MSYTDGLVDPRMNMEL